MVNVEEIWKDAETGFTKKEIIKSGEDIKKDRIRRLNQDNFYVANCKVCNCEIKLSCRYSGEYPLCIAHRDPNDRPINDNKYSKNNKYIKDN